MTIPTIPPFPPAPVRSDSTTFDTRADATMARLEDLPAEMNAVSAAIDAVALAVSSGAASVTSVVAAASASASAAAAASNASIWVSGTTYEIGDVRFSPLDFYSYRRKTAGAGTTDPSVDATNWVLLQLQQARSAITAVAALDIDCSLGNYFTKTIAGNSTFTVSNVPTGVAYAFTLELTHTSGAVTWFSGVQWPAGTAPTLNVGKVHLFVFCTDDGGSVWHAGSLVNYGG